MTNWKATIENKLAERLIDLGLTEKSDGYFLKSNDNELWAGVLLSTSKSKRHLNYDLSACFQYPSAWRLAKKFEPYLKGKISDWQWIYRKDVSIFDLPTHVKVDTQNFTFIVDTSDEVVEELLDAVAAQCENAILPFVEKYMSLCAVLELIPQAETRNTPLLTKHVFPILFMEVGKDMLARESLEALERKGALSSEYVSNFRNHYKDRAVPLTS